MDVSEANLLSNGVSSDLWVDFTTAYKSDPFSKAIAVSSKIAAYTPPPPLESAAGSDKKSRASGLPVYRRREGG